MSMGARMRTALLVLKDEGVPSDIGTGELEKRIEGKLIDLGYRRGEIPSHRTFMRHVADLKALLQPADGTLWHFRDGTVIGITDAATEPPTTEGHDEMQSNHQTMIDITGASRTWVQEVPYDHPIDVILGPTYLHGNYLKFRQGDRVELQPADFSWMVGFLVVSVNRHGRTVSTRLQIPPTFLLGSLDRSPNYLIDELHKAEQDFQKGKITRAEFDQRCAVLQSLKDHGKFPSAWLAALLQQLNRALDAKLLTRLQHSNASQELFAVMDEAQMDEVAAIVNKLEAKAEASSAATEAPAVNGGSAEKPRKKLTLATPPSAPAEFGQLKCVDAPPEIRELPNKVIAGDPLMKS